MEAIPKMTHPPTSEELRLRVVAQTNGKAGAAARRARSHRFGQR